MASNDKDLQAFLEEELKAEGFVLDSEFAMAGKFAKAVAKAVVKERTQNAEVIIDKGSSAGTYKVS
ncbi:hypothetical protein GNP81_10235 [Aliivibrio fischeri]|uniref:Uncharacterized protein n=1 Tax=Aliivibrio fischeri TaxID=668 RepID=A0A6N3YY15_ALIFS|nr:hypothetical protein [Aliivibrio fischeri]MUH96364.1 hypothetical protein [Aliivibrio fischeri]MUI63934.1 hypothetical protein [Aliivibrio fischeri]MUK46952.1 hypothetical protein [Aliivibrio fischeri]MUK63266.1 hypothetical protein [Aliivibrio fischeri]MUK81737.1 hypothetical protein [Aliivibrio fischeri]